jgi:hypothetical protein
MFAIQLCISVLALSADASRILERSTEYRAKMWLKTHDPSADEAGMNDLKNSDPNAFAIVQALLTKKSLGLLDPNHPSASMTGAAPKTRRTFQEEAAEAGLTQDSQSPELSEMVMQSKSSMPYPAAGSASEAPYPDVHASHDPWNYKTVHSDDDLVNSVIGADSAPAPVQTQDSLSLSAVTAQESQSMPAPVEHRASASDSLESQMPSLNWGNPMSSGAEEATAPAAQQPAQADSSDDDKSLSLSAVRSAEESRMGITEPVARFAPPAPVAQMQPAPQPEPVMYAQPASDPHESLAAMAVVASNFVQPVPEPAPEPAPVVQSYAAPSTPSMDAPWTPPAEPKLAMSSYHMHMSSYRMNMHADDAIPNSDDILSLRKQNMGNSYNSYLKEARTNRWKRAMDVTMNMQPPSGQKNNAYLADLS